MQSPNEIFSLSPAAGMLHVLMLALVSSLWGAVILRFAIAKVTGVKLKYTRAYFYNLIVATTVISLEFLIIYKATKHTVLSASDFIGPGNWFALMCSAGLAIFLGTVVLGYLIKDDRQRRIGTNKSFAASLIYAAIFVPIGLSFRALYFYILQLQSGTLF